MIFYEGDKVAWTEPGTQKSRQATVVGTSEGFPELVFINTKTDNGMQRCIAVQPNELNKINKTEVKH